MSLSRDILLWASENQRMRRHVPTWKFVKHAVKKFMPGENLEDALDAADKFQNDSIPVVLTRLGENIKDLSNGVDVCDHYLKAIDRIVERKLDIELSIKLTQIGFDISFDETYALFKKIAGKVKEELGNILWIDMEGSAYTKRTIDFYKKIKSEYSNIGICVQAYLYSTEADINDILNINPNIRLVKGAYSEPSGIAFPKKEDVDKNYLHLAKIVMKNMSEKKAFIVFATHDENICAHLIREAKHYSVHKNKFEFQMLYGIKPAFQKEMKNHGFRLRVLISYGDFWYPWYMRRLAERPANVWFVLKNIFN